MPQRLLVISAGVKNLDSAYRALTLNMFPCIGTLSFPSDDIRVTGGIMKLNKIKMEAVHCKRICKSQVGNCKTVCVCVCVFIIIKGFSFIIHSLKSWSLNHSFLTILWAMKSWPELIRNPDQNRIQLRSFMPPTGCCKQHCEACLQLQRIQLEQDKDERWPPLAKSEYRDGGFVPAWASQSRVWWEGILEAGRLEIPLGMKTGEEEDSNPSLKIQNDRNEYITLRIH